MSYERNDGGPAFPVSGSAAVGSLFPGMSLRDWLAGQVLAGIIGTYRGVQEASVANTVAVTSYAIADAMLKERQP